jgi:RimJ/RimL family protein N-acetyltransferase
MIIINLTKADRFAIAQHLTGLSLEDRHLRFFSALSDYAINTYVDKLDFYKDRCFGVFDDTQHLVAFIHISMIEKLGSAKQVDIGISVNKAHRGKGIAKALINRAIGFCKALNISLIYMCCLRENKTMQHIARSAGLKVSVDADEAYAELELKQNLFEHATAAVTELQITIMDKIFRYNADMSKMLGLTA